MCVFSATPCFVLFFLVCNHSKLFENIQFYPKKFGIFRGFINIYNVTFSLVVKS